MSNRLLLEPIVRATLLEDLGRNGDLTTDAIIPDDQQAVAEIRARENGVIAGIEAARLAFRMLDPNCVINISHGDGSPIEAGGSVMRIEGKARALLTAERTALNFMGRLCGIATMTAAYVREVAHTKTAIVCTRKTTPGLRFLEKEAVRLGGGKNHRFGLDDAVLIKDNHLVAAGGIAPAIERVRAYVGHLVKIELEVDNLHQLEQALALGVEIILLDNMSSNQLRVAVDITAGRALLEASGSMGLERVREVAETGVDLISVGKLTHSVRNIDLGLDFF
jgi:nicotinate-nucleotide pyrophosphorylase (carboxylating)